MMLVIGVLNYVPGTLLWVYCLFYSPNFMREVSFDIPILHLGKLSSGEVKQFA